MRRLLSGFAAALMALTIAVAPAIAAHPGAKPGDETIVEIVLVADGEFDVLQAAVIEAGLAGALSDTSRQYTVFAPTDLAFVTTFRALLGNTGLTEADVIAFIEAGGVDGAFGDGALKDILLYHVTNGRRTSTSVRRRAALPDAERLEPQPTRARRGRHRRRRHLRLERRDPRHRQRAHAVGDLPGVASEIVAARSAPRHPAGTAGCRDSRSAAGGCPHSAARGQGSIRSRSPRTSRQSGS